MFEIVGMELFDSSPAPALDSRDQSCTLDVTVEVDDAAIVGATPEDTAPLAITITDVNEAADGGTDQHGHDLR